MSTGGNVPTQGVAVQAATTEKKRNSAGKLGDGTAGSRLKSAWQRAVKAGYGESLRLFVKMEAKYSGTADTDAAALAADAKFWLSTKRYRGSDSQRAERKAKGERVRSLAFSDSNKLATPAKKKKVG